MTDTLIGWLKEWNELEFFSRQGNSPEHNKAKYKVRNDWRKILYCLNDTVKDVSSCEIRLNDADMPEIYDLIRQHELMETPAIPVPLETGEFAEYPNKAKAGASANQTLIDLLHEVTGVVLARKNDRAWPDNTPYYDGLITRLQAAKSTLKSSEISDNEPSGYHYDNFRYENKSIPSEISDNTTEVLWVKQPVTEMTEEEAEYWRQHQPTKREYGEEDTQAIGSHDPGRQEGVRESALPTPSSPYLCQKEVEIAMDGFIREWSRTSLYKAVTEFMKIYNLTKIEGE